MTPPPRSYFVGVGVGVDQLFNALAGGNPDETMSSSLWASYINGPHYRRSRAAVFVVNVLAQIVTFGHAPDHCRNSYERLTG